MKSKPIMFIHGLVLLTLLLSACIPLPISQLKDEPAADLPLGPQISAQEQQVKVFETLWSGIQEHYIHAKNSGVDLETLHDETIDKINAGLSSEDFNALLHDLEDKLPAGDFAYVSRTEKIDGLLASTGTYSGIGAFVRFQGDGVPRVVILDVIPDSPAEKAGLQAHDSILAVDGEPIRLEEGQNAINRVRGPEGSDVTLTIQTPGRSTRDVKLTRAKINSSGVLKAEILPDTKIGYILFPASPYGGMTNDIVSALTEFSKDPELKGLILDMRISNSTSWPIQEMLTMFQNGNVGDLYDTEKSQPVTITGQDVNGSQTLPIAVLVGEYTSGIPELFAAAMQANDRAILVGAPTGGNIEVLNGYLLPDGSEYFIASTSFRVKGGDDVGLNGINPKVKVEAGWDEIVAGDDPVIKAAVESLEASQ